ncbi:hypothetical protein RQP46_001512 [Phenoliferia psychrophenolica]
MASPLRAVVIGGSLGGLLTGIVLIHLGFAVTILERSEELHDAGAGIVLGGDLLEFLRTFDADQTNLAVESKGRVYLDRRGDLIPGSQEDRRQLMSSWDSLYFALRSNFDGGRRDGTRGPGHDLAEYKLGCVGQDITFDSETEEVTVTYSQAGSSHALATDLVVVADGASSSLRKKYVPNVKRTYAGYLGFRGLAKESELPEESRGLFDWFSFFHSGTNDGKGNTQVLTYLIPGEGGNLTPGERNLNWVWYENYRNSGAAITEGRNTMEEEDLGDMLTDKDAVVRATPKPFIQAISDTSPPLSTLVFSHARTIFCGDAVVGPRPHTAASTNQGALHALTLFYLLHDSAELASLQASSSPAERRTSFAALKELLREGWEKKAAQYARMLYASGKEMGDRSQFGTHPFSVDKPVEVRGKETSRPPHGRTLSGVAL